MKVDLTVDEIVSDACAQAQLDLMKRINYRMQHRQNEMAAVDWQEAFLEAFPEALKIALSQSLKRVLSATDRPSEP